MSKSKRVARPLLVACGGLAAIAFGNVTACGSAATGSVACHGCCPDTPCGTPIGPTSTIGSTGSGGSTGGGQQYCGVPDGGTPIPCFPDGGPDTTTGGGSGSGGTT